MTILSSEEYFARAKFTGTVDGITFRGIVSRANGECEIVDDQTRPLYIGNYNKSADSFSMVYGRVGCLVSKILRVTPSSGEEMSSVDDLTFPPGAYTVWFTDRLMLKLVVFPDTFSCLATPPLHYKVCMVFTSDKWDEDAWVESLLCTEKTDLVAAGRQIYTMLQEYRVRSE